MITFERLPEIKSANGNLSHYYFYMRSKEEFIISMEVDFGRINEDKFEDTIDEMLEFLMYSTKGHVVAPIVVYLLWEKYEKANRRLGAVYFSFTSLSDAMSFKLAYGDHITDMGVFSKLSEGSDIFNPIETPTDILQWRPNANLAA